VWFARGAIVAKLIPSRRVKREKKKQKSEERKEEAEE
jgi:hypothetical protein